MGKVIEINCETGETVERDMTSEEIELGEIETAKYQERQAAEEAETAAKAAAKASALAKLAALGLTEEEAAAIAGA